MLKSFQFNPYPPPLWQIQSQLLVAIQYRDLDQCAKLLAAGADCDQIFKINCQNKPALCIAVERCAYKLVELLIKSGSAINRQDSMGSTPLHIAVEMGYESICELLIANRADINAMDNQGVTPLHVGAKRSSPALVQSLISSGADVNRKDHMGKTPFTSACSGPIVNLEIVQLLIKNGSHVDELDKTGYTPLTYLLHSPQFSYETLKNLVENGARVDVMTSEGEAPIHMTVLSNNPEKLKCLDLLLKYGSNVNLQTNNKRTALHLSVLKNDIASAKILIRANADVNTVDRLGSSPLSHALCSGYTDLIDLLIDGGANMGLDDATKCGGLDNLKAESKKIVINRLSNPRLLKEISRIRFTKRFGPYTADWLGQHGDQYPATLFPYLMFEK